jgi:hypothetical protein
LGTEKAPLKRGFFNEAISQCGNAAMKEGALCVAARRQSLRVVPRRPATHGRASYIAALPHYRIATLFPDHFTTLTKSMW